MSTYPYVHRSYVHGLICPQIHMSTVLSVHRSICSQSSLSTDPYVHSPLCPQIHMSTVLSVHRSICPQSSLSTDPYVHSPLCPQIHMFTASMSTAVHDHCPTCPQILILHSPTCPHPCISTDLLVHRSNIRSSIWPQSCLLTVLYVHSRLCARYLISMGLYVQCDVMSTAFNANKAGWTRSCSQTYTCINDFFYLKPYLLCSSH